MNKLKDEIFKSIKYIIPIIVAFIGVLVLKHFSSISNFIVENLTNINDILAPFFIGFIIAYILNQPVKYLETKFKIKRGLCISLIYGIGVTIIIFGLIFIVPTIKSNINELHTSLPKGINQIENLINNMASNLKFNINDADVKLKINEFITNIIVPFSSTAANFISEFISAIVSYTVNIFLGIVISIYLLLSKEKYLEAVNLLGQKIFKKHYLKIKEFVNILDKNIGVYIVAKATDSTIYAIICTIILYLVNAKYALLLGIIAGVTNMIPFFGPIIGTIIAVVVNLFFSFNQAIVVLIVMIVVQQLESAVLEPYFVGKQVGVPPIFTILAVTIASKYFGLIGILLSVPIAGVILIYSKRFLYKDTLIEK